MAWEWMVLAVVTVVGPSLFHRFLPTREEIAIRGGAVFIIHFGPVMQILRTCFKFAVVWAIALLLAQLENRLWLRLWIVSTAMLGFIGHFVVTRRHRVHWLAGTPLSG